MNYDIAVVGGGITGLTAAFFLQKKGFNVVLLEASERFGGSVETVKEEGYLFETGPQTILANREEVWKLLAELGLKPEELPYDAKRFIYKSGKLLPVPLKPWEFLSTPLLSLKAKLRILFEPFAPEPKGEEESVADFVRRRLGREVLDYFVQPFVSGIYAGDSEKLSLRYAFPRLYEMERRYRSLLKAFFKTGRVAPKGKLISFKGGLSELTDALAVKIKHKLPKAEVLSLKREGKDYILLTKVGELKVRSVVFALPSYRLAEVLKETFPPAEVFREIKHPPLAVVSVSFPKRFAPEGFGFLVPKKEGLKILGALFISSLFPERCPRKEECLSVFVGGATDPQSALLKEEEIERLVLKELKKVFPEAGEPTYLKVRKRKFSIPQYEVGYRKVLEAVHLLEENFKGVKVISNFVGGSSLSSCIAKGLKVAEELNL